VAATTAPSLRGLALRAGVYLCSRQLIGVAGGVVAIGFLTRELGAAKYGSYAVVLALVSYLQTLGNWGITAYLVRAPLSTHVRELEHQATALLAALACVVTVVALGLIPVAAAVVGVPHFAALAALMVMTTPAVLLTQVPLARLEREIRYREVTTSELATQILFFATAIALVTAGFGVWALAFAYVAQQLAFCVTVHAFARYRPRLRWRRDAAGDMLRYGSGYAASLGVWQARALVNPLIVAPLAGPAAAGVLALSIRLVDVLAVVKSATWRLAMPVLARLAREGRALGAPLNSGMLIQIFGNGIPLAGFALLTPTLVHGALGPSWASMPVIFPFVALSYVVNAIFALHSSALYVMRKNWAVTQFHVAHVAVLFAVAAALVPRYGLVGYGIAELAAFPAYLMIVRAIASCASGARYGAPLVWLISLAPVLWEPKVGPVALLAPVFGLLLPVGRNGVAALRRLALNADGTLTG
jgi:O-antigen/teichoic acid export membrane protein